MEFFVNEIFQILFIYYSEEFEDQKRVFGCISILGQGVLFSFSNFLGMDSFDYEFFFCIFYSSQF